MFSFRERFCVQEGPVLMDVQALISVTMVTFVQSNVTMLLRCIAVDNLITKLENKQLLILVYQ